MLIPTECPYNEDVLLRKPYSKDLQNVGKKDTNPSKCNRRQEDQDDFHVFSPEVYLERGLLPPIFQHHTGIPLEGLAAKVDQIPNAFQGFSGGVVLPDQLHEASI